MPEKSSPPFPATVDPDFKSIITESDPTAFVSLSHNGEGERLVWDGRPGAGGGRQILFFLYTAAYDDGQHVEVRLEKDTFGSQAENYANNYAIPFGRLPRCVRQDVKALAIMTGYADWGGATDHIAIYSGNVYENLGLREEALMHEACHTSLPHFGSSREWRDAQMADPAFISNYARDNPEREDIAESFVAWIGLRYRPDRLAPSVRQKITDAIPNRIRLFDSVPWSSMHPLTLPGRP
jgi:hypothetical protein